MWPYKVPRSQVPRKAAVASGPPTQAVEVVGAVGPRHVTDNADKALWARHHVALSLAPSGTHHDR